MNFSFFTHYFSFISSSPLLFTGMEFWVFLLIVMFVFAAVKNYLKVSHLWLLIASVFFYYKSSGNFVVLLLLTTIITYLFSILVRKYKNILFKRILLFSGILLISSFLLYFKYTYFIIDLLNSYCGTNIVAKDYLMLFANHSFGTNFSVDKIILPVGISFYTFQAISFLVDTCKNKLGNKVSFLDFAMYLTFFPQLVAGPIVRADVFIPQLKNKWSLTNKEFNVALFFILNGLIKKIFVADYISLNFVDRVFSAPQTYSSMENLFAMYGYTMQIYCDFSGYTDIAIALSLLFGFHLQKNFNSPYKALNVTDFWRRWHISLSTWLRDYIYIPLGGNRKGKIRRYINLLTTMFVGGFWHGANLKFIFWGIMHGVLLVIDKLISPITTKLQRKRIFRILMIIITFHLVNILWIFFRADTFSVAMSMINRILGFNLMALLPVFIAYWKPITVIFAAFVIHLLPEKIKEIYRQNFYHLPWLIKIICVVLVVFILIQVKSSAIQPFIYFQF